jgi:hypothetical protein
LESLPLIILPDSNNPEAAEVLIDGKIGATSCRFLLDTGAAITCVDFDDYTSTFKRVGTKETAGAFSKSSLDLIIAPSISIGPFTEHILLVSRSKNGSKRQRNLIGMNFLKNLCIYFYFDSDRVEAGPLQQPKAGCGLRPLTLGRSSHPYLAVNFGGWAATAVWDTGAGMTVVDKGFVDNHPAFFRPSGISKGNDSAGAEEETPAYVMEGATIGGRRFDHIKVSAFDFSRVTTHADIPFEIILGYNLIKQANWCFDFPAKKWGFLDS